MPAMRILVPVDFSLGARAALVYALTLARDKRRRIDLLHVAESEHQLARAEDEMRAFLAPLLLPTGVDLSPRFDTGAPAERILRAAMCEGIDLIVLGAHGTARRTNVRVGDVAERIVQEAPCQVLVISGGDDGTEGLVPWLPCDHTKTRRVQAELAGDGVLCSETGERKQIEQCLACSKFVAGCLSLTTNEKEILCRKDRVP